MGGWEGVVSPRPEVGPTSEVGPTPEVGLTHQMGLSGTGVLFTLGENAEVPQLSQLLWEGS